MGNRQAARLCLYLPTDVLSQPRPRPSLMSAAAPGSRSAAPANADPLSLVLAGDLFSGSDDGFAALGEEGGEGDRQSWTLLTQVGLAGQLPSRFEKEQAKKSWTAEWSPLPNHHAPLTWGGRLPPLPADGVAGLRRHPLARSDAAVIPHLRSSLAQAPPHPPSHEQGHVFGQNSPQPQPMCSHYRLIAPAYVAMHPSASMPAVAPVPHGQVPHFVPTADDGAGLYKKYALRGTTVMYPSGMTNIRGSHVAAASDAMGSSSNHNHDSSSRSSAAVAGFFWDLPRGNQNGPTQLSTSSPVDMTRMRYPADSQQPVLGSYSGLVPRAAEQQAWDWSSVQLVPTTCQVSEQLRPGPPGPPIMHHSPQYDNARHTAAAAAAAVALETAVSEQDKGTEGPALEASSRVSPRRRTLSSEEFQMAIRRALDLQPRKLRAPAGSHPSSSNSSNNVAVSANSARIRSGQPKKL